MSNVGRLKKFSGDELERLLRALEYYTVQDDINFDLEDEFKDEIKRRETCKCLK